MKRLAECLRRLADRLDPIEYETVRVHVPGKFVCTWKDCIPTGQEPTEAAFMSLEISRKGKS